MATEQHRAEGPTVEPVMKSKLLPLSGVLGVLLPALQDGLGRHGPLQVHHFTVVASALTGIVHVLVGSEWSFSPARW